MKTSPLAPCRLGMILPLALVIPGASAATTTYTWTGGAADGLWFSNANWGTGAVPGSTQTTTDGDTVVLGSSASGTINYTPGAPAAFDRLTVTNAIPGALTLNINGDLTTRHVSDLAGDTYASGTATGRNLVVNITSGSYLIENAGLTLSRGNALTSASMTVGSGASLIAFSGSTATAYNNTPPIQLVGGSLTVRGTLATRSLASESALSAAFQPLRIGGGTASTFTVDGGTVRLDGITSVTNTGDGNAASLVINSGSDVVLRHGGAGVVFRANYAGDYANTIAVNGGSLVNHGQLLIGGVNSNGTTRGGTTTMTISGAGAAWNQNGVTSIGNGAVGVVNVTAGSFNAAADVYVGGGVAAAQSVPAGTVATSGTLTVDGGDVVIHNADAGLIRTVAATGRLSAGNAFWFGQGAETWDGTSTGQRVRFTSLAGAATQLSTGVAYYATDLFGISGQDAKSSFGVSGSLGGAAITGTASYTDASYTTLAARLVIGSTMTFAGNATRDIAGVLNIQSGSLTVDELVANKGAGLSTINFGGGTVTVGNTFANLGSVGSDIDTGSALVVGDNAGAIATLRFNGGLHTIVHGLLLNSDGRLAGHGVTTATIGGSGSIEPGDSPGVLAVAAIAPAAGLDFHFEFTAAGAAPLYDSPASSLNDVLRLTATTPFEAALTADNIVNAYFGVSALSAGASFTGGFFADAGDFAGAIAGATFSYYILGDGNGTHAYNGAGYYTLEEYNSLVGSSFAFGYVVEETVADFGASSVPGYITRFTETSAIPEPSAAALLGGAAALAACARRRRRIS